MTTYGFLIDNRRCIGCHACSVACKVEHQVPVGVARTWVKYVEKGVYPETRRIFQVTRCNHCTDAPCVEICPTGARKFGNVLDPKSEVSEILKTKRVFVLKEDVGTLPRFFYYFDERYPNSLDPEAVAIAERLRAEEGDAYGRLPGAAGPDKHVVAAATPAWWNGAHT